MKRAKIKVTPRWKQTIGYWKANRIAESSLRVYTNLRGADLEPIVLSQREVNRRTYNRYW